MHFRGAVVKDQILLDVQCWIRFLQIITHYYLNVDAKVGLALIHIGWRAKVWNKLARKELQLQYSCKSGLEYFMS